MKKIISSSTSSRYTFYICNGEAAASRGSDPDTFDQITKRCSSLKDAFLQALCIVYGYGSVKELSEEYPEALEDPEHALHMQDPTSGDRFVYGIEDDGGYLVFDFSFDEMEELRLDSEG